MASGTSGGNPKNLKHNARYYFPGGDLIIAIDDTAFCVSSYFFTRESPSFRELLEANPDAEKNEIPKDKRTVVIQPSENVTPEDFEKLCWVFYNETFGIYDAPLETWKTILRLATQYKFQEIRNLAFRELDTPGKFNPPLVERIILYRLYEADTKYLEPLYANIFSRPEPLTLEEAAALGIPLTLSISHARERLRGACEKLSPQAPLPDHMKNIVTEMVRSTFWDGPAPDLSCLSGTTASTNTTSTPAAGSQNTGGNPIPKANGHKSKKG